MRLVIVIRKVPPEFSGSGRRGMRLAKALSELGAEVTVITFTRNAKTGEGSGITVRPLGPWRGEARFAWAPALRIPSTLLAAARTMGEAFLTIRRARPDVVFLLGCGIGNQLVGTVALAMGVPVVSQATLAGSDDAAALRRNAGGKLRLALLKRSTRVVNISPPLHATALEAGVDPVKCEVIPNDVDTERFFPVGGEERDAIRSRLGLPLHDPIFVSVGRLTPRKGMLELARAFVTDVLNVEPSAHLLLLGPDERLAEPVYTRELQTLVTSPEARGHVILGGEVDDVATWLQASDAFVFASRAEGFPNVLIEALACGLPIVSSGLHGVTEFILGGAPGTEIVSSDADLGPAMVRALESIRNDQVSSALSTRANEHFSASVVHRTYDRLFRLVHRQEPGSA